MRLQNRFLLHGLASLWLLCANALATGTSAWEDPNTPQLEIRQYRFAKNRGFDRLVLEFERKDSNGHAQPTVHAEKAGGKNWNVTVSNSVLLGAIPESLINDLYARKSRFLGPVSVNMDAAKGGFSLSMSTKGVGTIKASWLSNPARLVIDASGRRELASEDEGETVSFGHQSKHPTLAQLICFPATAKVGLTVIFRPTAQQNEELQNIRVNTDGSATTEAALAADQIVCYPKRAQILAALSFEDLNAVHAPAGTMSYQSPAAASTGLPRVGGAPAGLPPLGAPVGSTLPPLSAPAGAAGGAASAKLDSDLDLDPGPIQNTGGGNPVLGGLLRNGGRAPASASVPTLAAPAGAAAEESTKLPPAGLLPPISH